MTAHERRRTTRVCYIDVNLWECNRCGRRWRELSYAEQLKHQRLCILDEGQQDEPVQSTL